MHALDTLILPSITEIVSGKARGMDTLGEKWAKEHNIPIKEFPADWNKYGKSAGYRRNEQMSLYADSAVIIMTKGSLGSTHMKNLMEKVKKPVYLLELS